MSKNEMSNDDETREIRGFRQAQSLRYGRGILRPLMRQSDQIVGYEVSLSDIAALIQHDGLSKFVDRKTPSAIDELFNELQQLGKSPTAKRGDIGANLQVFATRIENIKAEISVAQSKKSQAEQIRQTLVANEEATKEVLRDVRSADLKPAFDQQFVTSANQLLDHFRELQSAELSTILERQTDLASAARHLKELQQQISDAQSRYNQAKKRDDERQVLVQRLSAALSDCGS